MASVKKRGKVWRARYLDPDGKERAQHFPTKAAADAWLAAQVTRLRDGSWVDPRLGKRTFGEYADQWLAAQLQHRPSTSTITRTRIEKHLRPAFGDRPLSAIQRSDVQGWVAKLDADYSASFVRTLYQLLSQILTAAVDDKMLSSSPCRRVNLPASTLERMVIPTTEQIGAVYAAAPAHGKALVVVGAATGLRASELCGLTVDRVDFLRRTITVDRQLVGVTAGSPRFGEPKTKASNRILPVPEVVTDAIAAHLAAYPTRDIIFRNERSAIYDRSSLAKAWAKWSGGEFNWHSLRHYYASALIAAGQSVKVVQERLGHGSAKTTMDTYSHLWPADEDATRAAVGGLIEAIARTPDGLLAQTPRSGA